MSHQTWRRPWLPIKLSSFDKSLFVCCSYSLPHSRGVLTMFTCQRAIKIRRLKPILILANTPLQAQASSLRHLRPFAFIGSPWCVDPVDLINRVLEDSVYLIFVKGAAKFLFLLLDPLFWCPPEHLPNLTACILPRFRLDCKQRPDFAWCFDFVSFLLGQPITCIQVTYSRHGRYISSGLNNCKWKEIFS